MFPVLYRLHFLYFSSSFICLFVLIINYILKLNCFPSLDTYTGWPKFIRMGRISRKLLKQLLFQHFFLNTIVYLFFFIRNNILNKDIPYDFLLLQIAKIFFIYSFFFDNLLHFLVIDWFGRSYTVRYETSLIFIICPNALFNALKNDIWYFPARDTTFQTKYPYCWIELERKYHIIIMKIGFP